MCSNAIRILHGELGCIDAAPEKTIEPFELRRAFHARTRAKNEEESQGTDAIPHHWWEKNCPPHASIPNQMVQETPGPDALFDKPNCNPDGGP